jgi:TonB-dependent Receptor Plug Domain
MSPVTGSELPIGKVPAAVSTVTAADITRSGAVTVEEALQTSVAGVILSDQQGITASPVDGVPQGLAVYQNGVRINGAFVDALNWDFLPSVATDSITVMSNNPVFGLNAFVGAASIAMKDRSFALSDAVKLSGVAYYRYFNQQHVDGNISSAQDCGGLGAGAAGLLCLVNVDGTITPLVDQNGKAIPTPAGVVGEIDRTSVDAHSYGGSLQATDKSQLLGHSNQFIIGGSIDHGEVNYGASSVIGTVESKFIVSGTGAIIPTCTRFPL